MSTRYIIEAESGVNQWAFCTVGEGATIAEAWEDAVGPKPWTPYQKKLAKKYILREESQND